MNCHSEHLGCYSLSAITSILLYYKNTSNCTTSLFFYIKHLHIYIYICIDMPGKKQLQTKKVKKEP